MIITLIIVGGITIISVIAVVGDYLTKVKTAKPSIDVKEISELKKRIEELEKVVGEQDKKIEHLETDISFANKLLEDKTK
jgi:peptidoglycan hydrolase CwlO-like protein